MSTTAYAALVEKGCLCGTDRPVECPLHTEPSDNRGIAAYYKAGMPQGFPLVANCILCGAEGLLYPDIEIDDPKRGVAGEAPKHHPTLICPRCSGPNGERALVTDAEQFGYELNDRRVFA